MSQSIVKGGSEMDCVDAYHACLVDVVGYGGSFGNDDFLVARLADRFVLVVID